MKIKYIFNPPNATILHISTIQMLLSLLFERYFTIEILIFHILDFSSRACSAASYLYKPLAMTYPQLTPYPSKSISPLSRSYMENNVLPGFSLIVQHLVTFYHKMALHFYIINIFISFINKKPSFSIRVYILCIYLLYNR